MRHQITASLVILTSLASGCLGELAVDTQLSDDGAFTPAEGPPLLEEVPALESDCADILTPPGRAPLQRLTRAQYDNTARDLLGVDLENAEQSFVPDARAGSFPSNATEAVADLHVRHYADAAAELAETVDVVPLTPCDDATAGRACAESFIRTFGRRAFRRPLSEGDVADFLGLYDTAADFDSGIRLLVRAFLQSPELLYLPETGRDGASDMRPLTDFELATRLSYFLWNTTPDQRLAELADSGELSDPAVLQIEADRMLRSPRASEAIEDFIVTGSPSTSCSMRRRIRMSSGSSTSNFDNRFWKRRSRSLTT